MTGVSDIYGLWRILIEAGVLLCLAVITALGVNAYRSRQPDGNGILITRNYFELKVPPPSVERNIFAIPEPSSKPPSNQPAPLGQSSVHGYQVISLKELYQLYKQNWIDTVVIDARAEEQYQSSHIPGAISFDYYHPDRNLKDVLETARAIRRVVIYCTGGNCEDSVLAAQYLTQEIDEPLDFFSVYIFEGGFTQWCKAGYPVEPQGAPCPE